MTILTATLEEQLKALTALDPDYELLQRRRAQFQKQVREYNENSDGLWDDSDLGEAPFETRRQVGV